jgi:hypothetical protein
MNDTNSKAVTGEGSALRDSFKLGAVYLLVRDVKNPTPDRRQKYDWTAQTNWLAGTRFRIVTEHIYEGVKLLAITTGKYDHHRILLRKAPAELLAALEETTPSLHESLRLRGLHHYKDEALDNLVSSGIVTVEQVINAAQSAADEETV